MFFSVPKTPRLPATRKSQVVAERAKSRWGYPLSGTVRTGFLLSGSTL